MSKPQQARERLFRYGRPNIRPLEIEEDGEIGMDMAILWAAYKKGSFDMTELTQEQFTERFLKHLEGYYAAWVVEDKNYRFGDGYGAVGIILARFNGWAMEPQFFPFSWATDKNKLKMVVSFMQMARYEKGIGTLNISTTDEAFFNHIRKQYGVVYFVGKIPKGNSGKDMFIFYGRGKDFFKRAA